jgi:putative transposase
VAVLPPIGSSVPAMIGIGRSAGIRFSFSEIQRLWNPLSAHRDDAEFGHRFLVEEARHAGEAMAERTAWRICSQHRLWSVFGKKRGKNGKVGPPVHDDLVERDFTTESPNLLWLADITEHPTREGKLYLCAIKDVFLSASWATASTPG